MPKILEKSKSKMLEKSKKKLGKAEELEYKPKKKSTARKMVEVNASKTLRGTRK